MTGLRILHHIYAKQYLCKSTHSLSEHCVAWTVVHNLKMIMDCELQGKNTKL